MIMINPVFFEVHSNLPRQGPGNFEATRLAFSHLEMLPDRPRLLDVGCGPGMQTLDLARLTKGSIVAVDNHQPYVDRLSEKIQQSGLDDRVSVVCADMFDLPFAPGEFDVIWSEGAIYIIGFDRGLSQWRSLLKPGGYLAVSELTWLQPNPPEAVRSFWEEGYPAMRTMDENLAAMEENGYAIVDAFPLPESAWWDNYYSPLEQRISQLQRKYSSNAEALQVLDMERQEIDLYRRYSKFYGYVFYIAKLPA